MNPATTEFVRQRFTDYYRKAMLVSPSSLAQREWGFVLFNPGAAEMRMRRHIAFTDRGELFDYIKNLVPSHIYYSSAYYEKPDAPTMAEKGWCGADLIFDLDADHIVKGPYDQMLSRVKTETEKLLAMLTEELGIDPRQIELVFFRWAGIPCARAGSRFPRVGERRAAGTGRLHLWYRDRSLILLSGRISIVRVACPVPQRADRVYYMAWHPE